MTVAAKNTLNQAPAPPSDTTHLLLIRHGATAWNEARPPRLQGSGIDLELSPTGLRQAAALGAMLKRFPLAKVYCSHLQRARQTAAAIADPQQRGVQVLANMQEIHVGRWEGYDWPRIGREFPEEHRIFWDDYGSHPYLEGESFQDVLSRFEPVLLKLLQRHVGETIAVVGHGLANRIFLAKHLGLTMRAVKDLPQMNCCVNVIRGRAGEVQILGVNDVLHLEEWPE